jgi:hypothetical protein
MAVPIVNDGDDNFVIPISTSDSGAVNAQGYGLAGIWVGPFTGSTITVRHAPRAGSEPADADFEAMYDDDGNAIGVVTLPAGAASARVYVAFPPNELHDLHWLKLTSDGSEAAARTIIPNWWK